MVDCHHGSVAASRQGEENGLSIMRQGYRNLVMRRLREKLSLGSNTFAHGADSLLVQSVTETDERPAGATPEFHFADDPGGNYYVMNLDDGQVALINHETGHRSDLGTDLRAFVDALEPGEGPWD